MDEEKEYRVIISERAKRMLGAHIRFIAQVDKSAAYERKNAIISALNSLSKMPLRFPLFEASFVPPNKYRRMFIRNWYLAIYQVSGDTVYVDSIIDCRGHNKE